MFSQKISAIQANERGTEYSKAPPIEDFCGLLQKSFIISHAKIRIKSVVRLRAFAFIPGFSFGPLLMKAHSKQKNWLVWVIPKIGADAPHFGIAEFFLFNLIYKVK